MSRSEKEAIVICLDVGQNSASTSSEKNEKTFLERSIECVKKIIVRKIFAKPNDEIGIILFGCDATKNDLEYKNIVELDTLKMPSWSMLEELENIKQGKASIGWTDSVIVALNYLSNETQAKKFSHLRVILFTNFLTNADDSDLDVIIQNISNLDIEIIGVSDSVRQEESNADVTWQFSQNPAKKDNQLESERIFQKISESVETATLCHIDYVESQLVLFQKKTTRGNPWNVTLKIGSELGINVSAYVFIQKVSPISFKTECIELNTVTKMVTDYTKNNETIEKPREEDIVKAYMYGSKFIPIDDSNFLYDSGDKCLSCIAFSSRKSFNTNLFIGSGCHVVVPQKDSPKSATLFAALVQNMIKKDYFMVARKVYRKGTKVQVVGLFPVSSDNGMSLIMIELPYQQDIQICRYERFRCKKSAQPSEEQMEAMKKLVESMDLMNAVDDDSGITEAFTIETSPNPFHQYICRVVAHRALNPNEPLPTFHDELKKMIDVPDKIRKESADAIKEIERLFPLEIVYHKEKKVFGQKSTKDIPSSLDDNNMVIDSINDDQSNDHQIISVGTVTPAEDFLYLVRKKTERFGKLCEQIEGVIYELIFKTTTDFGDKIKESILAYRETAKVHGPFNYNTWIGELKKMMMNKNKIDEWNNYIVKEGLGLITINESPISTITIEENLEFYEIAKADASNLTLNTNPEDDELENLL